MNVDRIREQIREHLLAMKEDDSARKRYAPLANVLEGCAYMNSRGEMLEELYRQFEAKDCALDDPELLAEVARLNEVFPLKK